MEVRIGGLAAIVAAIALMAISFFAGKRAAGYREVVDVKRDTLIVVDTTFIDKPVPVIERVTEYIRVPVIDTLQLHDTTFVVLPRTQKEYSDSLYRAWVSGYKPALDSIEVYRRTEYIHTTETIFPKPRKWSVGVQAGIGAGKDGLTPYVGIGLSYSIFNF